MYKFKHLLASAVFVLFATASVAGVNIGVSVTGVSMDPVGKESTDTQTRSETLEAAIGEIFVEYDFGLIGIGASYVPYDIEGETVENNRDGETIDTGTTRVNVDIADLTTVYLTIDLADTGAYLKVGGSTADVITNEVMATGTTYPNETLTGAQVSLGLSKDLGMLSVRAELGYHEYEDLKAKGKGGDGDQNTVEIHDISGPRAQISLVKSF
tara:strand:+ start:1144 stop:1779 length:636 start_codon:yes stop_codon:yes gene_type:complete